MQKDGQQMETENIKSFSRPSACFSDLGAREPGFWVVFSGRALNLKSGWIGITWGSLKTTYSEFIGLGCGFRISKLFKISTSDSNYSKVWDPLLKKELRAVGLKLASFRITWRTCEKQKLRLLESSFFWEPVRTKRVTY